MQWLRCGGDAWDLGRLLEYERDLGVIDALYGFCLVLVGLGSYY